MAGDLIFASLRRVSVTSESLKISGGGYLPHNTGILVSNHGLVDTGIIHANTIGTFWLLSTAADLAAAADYAA